jgi:geranylgeranyl pyrophosphate synthase
MSDSLRAYVTGYTELINEALHARLPLSNLAGTRRLNEAILYAVFSGGKRMRPLLVLLGAGVCGAPEEQALPVAAAVEFLHAASLVFDDLPSMDDASTRRGLASLHQVFGEDIALLAGLALLNEAYAVFADTPALLSTAVREIGPRGMIGGQAADISGTHVDSRLEKTTSLLRLTMAAGAAAAGAGSYDSNVLIAFGESIGEAYQICDDMLDTLGAAHSGKDGDQDARHSRCNVAARLGYKASIQRVQDLFEGAIERLGEHFGRTHHVRLLEDFARVIVRSPEPVVYDPHCNAMVVPGAGAVERQPLDGI